MDIFNLIKNRRTIRKYKVKPVPKRIINKIIEAGRWGPSLLAPGLQPWRFIVVTDKIFIKKISDIMLKKSTKIGIGGNIVLRFSANTISNAPLLIAVYNTSSVVNLTKRLRKIYTRIAKFAEVSAIAAAIQNMLLVGENLGIGSCWHDTPLFCQKAINRLFNTTDELVAILSFGYPDEKGKRSLRKPMSETVKIMK